MESGSSIWGRRENEIPKTAFWIAAERRHTDPFAEHFLAAAGEYRSYRGSIFSARTAFFDEQLTRLSASVDQIVLLGAGLDTRSLRYPFAASMIFYELDLPVMVTFKEQVLASCPVELRHSHAARRVPVTCDFEAASWPSELLKAGFDPKKKTLWAMEGLVYYLSDRAVQHVFSSCSQLSAPGSTVIFDCLSHAFAKSLAGEPGQHWGVDDPIGFVNRFAFRVEGDPAQGGGRFFVTAHKEKS